MFFFFNDTATTEIYTLSLHDALPISITTEVGRRIVSTPEHTHFAGYRLGLTPQLYFTYLMHREGVGYRLGTTQVYTREQTRSEEHTSELQSRQYLVCRLLLEKKKQHK